MKNQEERHEDVKQFDSGHGVEGMKAPVRSHRVTTIGQQRWKTSVFLLVLALFVGLFFGQGMIANAQPTVENGTNPNGTIPPGGTIPAPLPDPTAGQIRIIHLAPIAPAQNDTTVDICTALNTPVAGLTGLQYLETSGYISLAPGTYQWSVGTPGCTTLLYTLPPFASTRGSISTILIVGGANGQPLTSIFVVDELGQFNRLYIPIVQR